MANKEWQCPDNVEHLYYDLYDKKVTSTMSDQIYYLNNAASANSSFDALDSIKKFSDITDAKYDLKNQWDRIQYMLNEYYHELNLNATGYVNKRKNFLWYKFIRRCIKIKYSVWILLWYITN